MTTFFCARVRPSVPGDDLPVATADQLRDYARRAMADCLRRGEYPFPWPGLDSVLDDAKPADREQALRTCLDRKSTRLNSSH